MWVRFPRISRMQNGILPGNINALPTTLASNIANHQYVHQNYHSTSSSSKHCYKEFIFLLKIYWIPLPRSNIRHIRDKDAESIRRASEERGGAKSGTDPALSSADFTTCAHDQCMNGAHVEAPTRVRTPHARTHTHTRTHIQAHHRHCLRRRESPFMRILANVIQAKLRAVTRLAIITGDSRPDRAVEFDSSEVKR